MQDPSSQLSEVNSDSSSVSWIDWFLSQRGHEFFAQIDEEFILDRFNLAGLNLQAQHFNLSIQVITDTIETELDTKPWEVVDRAARHLYGLIHARWILTTAGLSQMAEKYRRKDFGRCPRVLCEEYPVLPVGICDLPGVEGVKLYCPNCEDIYNPTLKKHNSVDGCYFTTTFPHLLLMVYPSLLPQNKVERYEPKIYGFRVHELAEKQRKQDKMREEMEKLKHRKLLLLKNEE